MTPHPLIAIPSPRDIVDVKTALDKLPADKYWVKYLREQQAYDKIRAFFLKNDEYTHLILNPDDLVVSPAVHNKLLEDLEQYPAVKVLSGVCNINSEPQYKGKVNVVKSHRINGIRSERKYDYLSESAYDPKMPVIPVMFAGFAYMWIARDVVERVPFRDDQKVNGQDRGSGGAVDVMFCNDCLDRGIDIWADMTARSDHLSSFNRTLKVGELPPQEIFEPSKIPF